jgi:uncharacterized protein
MTTINQIEAFLASEPVAFVGVSRNPKKFGYAAFKELKDKGLKLIPVNPSADEILGEKVYPDVKSLPDGVNGIIIMTKKEHTLKAIQEAKEKGIKQIWIQQHAESKEALAELKDTNINYITGECILMFYKPHSVHKFHIFLNRLFGKYPK